MSLYKSLLSLVPGVAVSAFASHQMGLSPLTASVAMLGSGLTTYLGYQGYRLLDEIKEKIVQTLNMEHANHRVSLSINQKLHELLNDLKHRNLSYRTPVTNQHTNPAPRSANQPGPTSAQAMPMPQQPAHLNIFPRTPSQSITPTSSYVLQHIYNPRALTLQQARAQQGPDPAQAAWTQQRMPESAQAYTQQRMPASPQAGYPQQSMPASPQTGHPQQRMPFSQAGYFQQRATMPQSISPVPTTPHATPVSTHPSTANPQNQARTASAEVSTAHRSARVAEKKARSKKPS